jgi:peptidoglycan hydrolase-like protein with peptidoglycan-binding domain
VHLLEKRYTNYMKKYLLIIAAVFIMPLATQAQINSTQSISACVPITYNLALGSTDIKTGGQVTALQKLLIYRGYLFTQSGKATGYYGPTTAAAVKRFQKDQKISPVGFVGPATRTKINTLCLTIAPTSNSCGSPGAMFDSRTGARCESSQTLQPQRDAKIKSTLAGLRASAEIIYDQSNPGSYNAVCDGGWINPNRPETVAAYKYFLSENIMVTCFSSGQKYVISAPLTNGIPWCIDSTGIYTAGSADTRNISCVSAQSQIPTASPSVTVVTPNGGEVWNLSQMMSDGLLVSAVNWNLQNITKTVHLDVTLMKGNTHVADHGSFILDQNGIDSSTVTFRQQNGMAIPVGNDYKILLSIKTPEGTIIAEDMSDNYFTIVSN